MVATMRTPEKEEKLTTLDHVLVEELDVTDQDSINKAVYAGIEAFGRIDVLVNNAGYGAYGLLEAFPRENIQYQCHWIAGCNKGNSAPFQETEERDSCQHFFDRGEDDISFRSVISWNQVRRRRNI